MGLLLSPAGGRPPAPRPRSSEPARDPPAGTKVVTNPKTQRAYDMLFITLGDHTGARIRAQLIGRPAKRAAAALDAERGGGRGGGETASRTTPFA